MLPNAILWSVCFAARNICILLFAVRFCLLISSEQQTSLAVQFSLLFPRRVFFLLAQCIYLQSGDQTASTASRYCFHCPDCATLFFFSLENPTQCLCFGLLAFTWPHSYVLPHLCFLNYHRTQFFIKLMTIYICTLLNEWQH